MVSKTIPCTFPNDLTESIDCQQVWILPNFAITDYAAQGKTRPFNVVHLNSCHSHVSYYTALSRSASVAGTIIVQGFDPSKLLEDALAILDKNSENMGYLMTLQDLDMKGNFLNMFKVVFTII